MPYEQYYGNRPCQFGVPLNTLTLVHHSLPTVVADSGLGATHLLNCFTANLHASLLR